MRAHDVAGRDSCRWIARCHRLAGAIDAGLLGGHQQISLPNLVTTLRTRSAKWLDGVWLSILLREASRYLV
jgi:hypothetical protein